MAENKVYLRNYCRIPVFVALFDSARPDAREEFLDTSVSCQQIEVMLGIAHTTAWRMRKMAEEGTWPAPREQMPVSTLKAILRKTRGVMDRSLEEKGCSQILKQDAMLKFVGFITQYIQSSRMKEIKPILKKLIQGEEIDE